MPKNYIFFIVLGLLFAIAALTFFVILFGKKP